MNDIYIAYEDGLYYVVDSIDHSDEDGNYGLSCRILGSPDGYETREMAELALSMTH